MGTGQNINSITPYSVPFIPYSGAYPYAPMSFRTESAEDTELRIKKENAKKASEEFLRQMEALSNKTVQTAKEEMEAPLKKHEKYMLREQGLKLEEESIKSSEMSLASSMLFTTPFLIPTLKSAVKPSKSTVNMFYKEGAPHMSLFSANPELMTNAQGSMQKLEKKFIRDFKAAKGNKALIKNIAEERSLFRDMMQKALNSNKPEEIAKVTEQFNVANGVKNGTISGLYRKFKKQPVVNSRFDAVLQADKAGKFASVKPPESGKSFLRNLCSSKITWLMSAAMAIVPVVLDWDNIQKAKEIDKQNAQKGKDTNYGNQQMMQTGIKGGASALIYSITDTAARTLAKKYLGKFAAKIAAKIAVKGGCKILGSAIGSVVPGVGTAIGLIAGTAADYLLNKYVFGNMDFFKNSSVTRAELESGSDEELLNNISEQYSMGKNVDKNVLLLLKQKCGNENFERLRQMHNMTEEERNIYLSKLYQNQQEQQTQQA